MLGICTTGIDARPLEYSMGLLLDRDRMKLSRLRLLLVVLMLVLPVPNKPAVR